MVWQFTPFVLPGLVASACAAGLAYYAARHRDQAPGVTAFAVFSLGVCIWLFFKAVELLGADAATKMAWLRIQATGLVLIPAAWFAFTWQYSHHQRHLSRRAIGLLAIHPVLVLLTMWTNDLHHLFWRSFDVVDNGLYIAARTTYGPIFWLHTAYSYGLIGLGTAFIARMLLHYQTEHLFGRQALALLLGALVPWMGNILYVFRLNPVPVLDSSSIGFAIGALILAWGIFQHGLFDIAPIAHDAIVRSLADGVIVLDAAGRIVELNPAAERILGKSSVGVVGQLAAQALFVTSPGVVSHLEDPVEARVEVAFGDAASSAERHFEVKVSPLVDRREQAVGRVLTLHDVTARKAEHAQLAADLAEAQRSHEQLVREHADLLGRAAGEPAAQN